MEKDFSKAVMGALAFESDIQVYTYNTRYVVSTRYAVSTRYVLSTMSITGLSIAIFGYMIRDGSKC